MARGSSCAGPAADEVEGRILADFETGVTHPTADERAGADHRKRVERARQAVRFIADAAEFVAAAHQLPR